jgi:hypothetical protein
MLDLVLEIPEAPQPTTEYPDDDASDDVVGGISFDDPSQPNIDILNLGEGLPLNYKSVISSFMQQLSTAILDPVATFRPQQQKPIMVTWQRIPAITPTGIGAVPLPDVPEAPNPDLTTANSDVEPLLWQDIYVADHDGCRDKLPARAARHNQVIVLKRGGCSFSTKLANIPAFAPGPKSLQLVVVVSYEEPMDKDANVLMKDVMTRPLLDQVQYTPGGLIRHHQISMVMVSGGEKTLEQFKHASSIGLRRRYHIETQQIPITNLIVV